MALKELRTIDETAHDTEEGRWYEWVRSRQIELSVNDSSSQGFRTWVGEIVRKTYRRTFVLRVLPEALPCDHYRDRGFCDKIVGERAKNDALKLTLSSTSQDHHCGRNIVDNFCDEVLWALAVDDFDHNFDLELSLPKES